MHRLRAALAALGAAVLGAAPHALHHVGPLAGAALLAGATGKILFGALGLLLSIPLLRRVRRRTGSWAVPAGVLALMAVAFTLSTFVVGPALTGGDDERRSSETPGQTQPAPADGEGHGTHHR